MKSEGLNLSQGAFENKLPLYNWYSRKEHWHSSLHFDLTSASQVTCQAGLVIKGSHLEWFSGLVLSDSFDPMDSSLPAYSVHAIFQARILE